MGRNPHATERPPELKLALRWLRHRLRLTQGEVAEAVSAQGGALSLRHYQDLENGRKFPSPVLQAQILRALGSDQLELKELLAARPWTAEPLGSYHASRVLPRPGPEVYIAAARRALESLPSGATWSNQVQAPAAAPAAGVDENEASALLEVAATVARLAPAAQQQVLDLARRLLRDTEQAYDSDGP
jgi:transcriptional regulator with XRE-family HTH domain